jgi:hypothetical protein
MEQEIDFMETWEFGAVGISDPNSSTLKRYFELIYRTRDIQGDIAEFGVSTGKSIITTSLISRKLDANKKIYGFDTFTGFPGFSENDNFDLFEKLFKQGEITEKHFRKIEKNREHVLTRGASTNPKDISNSGNFENTSLELVNSKIQHFGLGKNTKLIQGDFTKKLELKISDLFFSLVLIDSDLFESYDRILPIIWERLSPGGYIYLDEYYSLKFPGPRIAVNNFVAKTKCELIRLDDWLDFERWAIYKK